MKKAMKLMLLPAALVALSLTSCKTARTTSSSVAISPEIISETVADLDVAPTRVYYTYTPSKRVRRGGLNNVVQTAQSILLKQNGNADVLVDRQYSYEVVNGIFRFGVIKTITISGRPASYKNIRSAR